MSRVSGIGQQLRTLVRKAGVLVGTRTYLNFVEGSNTTITVADDSVNDEVTVTIASTASGGAAVADGPGANVTVDGTGAAGVSASAARVDHGHQVQTTDAPSGANITIDAAATAASAGAIARAAHGHRINTYSTAAAAIGTAAAGTSATAPSRGDHVHPTGAGTPSTQAFGDAAAVGTGPAAAMTDHKHAMPANPVRAQSSTTPSPVGTAAVGTGATDARSDHVHATGAGTPTTSKFGDAAATGSGPAASMTDHVHGRTWEFSQSLAADSNNVNNSSSLVDVNSAGTSKLGVAVAANDVWIIEYWLPCSGASATADWKLGLTVPVSSAGYWGLNGSYTAGQPGWGEGGTGSSPTAIALTSATISFGGASGIIGASISVLYIGGANGGTVQLQFAQNTPTVENNAIKAGASVLARRVT